MNEFSSKCSSDLSHWPLETKHLDSSSVICDILEEWARIHVIQGSLVVFLLCVTARLQLSGLKQQCVCNNSVGCQAGSLASCDICWKVQNGSPQMASSSGWSPAGSSLGPSAESLILLPMTSSHDCLHFRTVWWPQGSS